MTTEIVQFKCPSCGHLLGEEEYGQACENNKRFVDEKVEQELLQQLKQVKIEYTKQIQKINEKNELEKEQEVCRRVASVVSEEKTWMELKHKQEMEAKEKLIEAAKSQSATLVEEKIRHAIAENEVKHRQKEKEFEIQHNRIETDNKKLLDQVEKLQKTLDNIPPELRGTAGEFVLIDELKREFRTDSIVGKRVGMATADAVQSIVTEAGECIGIPIVYDRKTGDNITKLDIVKAKNYKTVHNTDHCLIVTEKGIKDNRLTEEREGVLLVHPSIVIDIAKRIRSFIIEASKQTKNNIDRDSKQSKLYEYLTSQEYDRDSKAKLETRSKLDDLQRKEEDYHRTIWNRRKEFIEKWSDLDRKNENLINDITQEDGEEPSF
jgi:hypothetical protein